MVFCYKTIMESPRRSPQKRRTGAWLAALSELPTLDDGTSSGLAIPEREWRLLAALAKKRAEEDEREKLAEQFRRMWQREKEGREMMNAETSLQYRRFIDKKRQDEHRWHEHRQLLKDLDQHLRKGRLMDTIRQKDQKTQEILAWKGDKKVSDLVNKAMEEEARALLAAERRSIQESAAAWRKRIEVEQTMQRVDEADKRRNEILRDSSRRLAITSALSTWEATLLREQLAEAEAARRAQAAARAARAAARGERVARAAERRRSRARAAAARCELWREALRAGSLCR